MDLSYYDPSTWTLEYAKQNYSDCEEVIMAAHKIARDFLIARNYQSAANALGNVVKGLTMLAKAWPDWSEHYNTLLFANFFELGKIYAFGLYDAENAQFCYEMSYRTAQKVSSASAKRDLVVIGEFLDDFKRGRPISVIRAEVGKEFPDDVIRSMEQPPDKPKSNSTV